MQMVILVTSTFPGTYLRALCSYDLQSTNQATIYVTHKVRTLYSFFLY